jgi:hypothetical protein
MQHDTRTVFTEARLSRVLRLFATQLAGAAACALLAAAQTNILPLPVPQVSTVPANGDVNPYGVAFVPADVPADGALQNGGILVSNFNNSANLQGTGTTIVQISPTGQNSLFFTSTQAGQTGLSAALGILSSGIVIAGYLPSTDGTSQTAGPGGLLFIDRRGVLLGKIADASIFNGPWGMAVADAGRGFAQVYVSNVESGNIVRLDLRYSGNGESLKIVATTTIGSGFLFSPDPAAFEVGPSGLAYDGVQDVLYVASEVDSSIYAIQGASGLSASAGTGTLVTQDPTHLHGPLDLALSPIGHVLVANSDGRNADPNQPSELTEFSASGQFLTEYSLDPNNGGAFGVAVHFLGLGTIRVAAVDDNQNVLNIWTTTVR